MKDEKKAPKLRFKGFTDDWEQCKLGDVAKITMGQSPNSKNYTDNPKDHILVQGNADMKDGQVHPRIWTTEITKIADKGDLILSVRAPVGDIGKTSYDVVIGRGVAAIKGNEFIFQLLKRMKTVGYWTKYSTGSTFESINSLEINNAVINLPKEHEQNEVGKILSYMDHAITLHEEKKRQLERLKSALLQKMFADKSGYPAIRFEGFSDEWEQCKVKDIFKITRGKVLAATETSEEKSDISPFPVYSSQTKNNGLMGYYKDYLFDTAITWTTDGANAGTVSYRSGRFYSTNVNGVLISDKGYANKAISEILNLEAWKWVSHVGNPKLMNNVMGDISIMIPSSFEEQDRLSDFLNQLDDTITLHNQKLNLLKLVKQSLLQNMFI